MAEQNIQSCIDEILTGDARNNALAFFASLKANDMQFERGGGYWEDKRYWMVKDQSGYVCFILVNSYGMDRYADEPEGWIIWSDASDTSDSQWYENAVLDDRVKAIAYNNIDFCGRCSPGSPCYGGIRKTIFGQEFDNVCRTTFRFDNPNADEVECAIRLVEMRNL